MRNPFAAGTERHEALLGVLVTQALRPLLKEHRDFWEFFTLTLANALTGYTGNDRAREEAEAYRSGMSPEAYLAASALESIRWMSPIFLSPCKRPPWS